ncbi:MAG: RimK family alpha-L-glutamate ligase [Desulfamplus sp.]|nr:RimK family alpha-L-glutamate ligase [Desulfamplus sp.]
MLSKIESSKIAISQKLLPKIALGSRFKNCRNIITLGFKPNFIDYSPEEIQLIRNADKIYYPTAFYANMFHIMGKTTFPSFTTYHFVQDKIRQTALFNLLNIPHPRTKVFYGAKQKQEILNNFSFPFIAKIPRGSSMGRGVYLINNIQELVSYLSSIDGSLIKPIEEKLNSTLDSSEFIKSSTKLLSNKSSKPAYIQEYLPHKRDIRVVVIGKEVAIAYWRVANLEDFRANISCGGDISFAPIPKQALELALYTAKSCGWDDVGLDIVESRGQFLVVEANMKYGRKGFVKAGIDYNLLCEKFIEEGKI